MKNHASMNRSYRLVWSAVLDAWVAVAENVRGQGKGGAVRAPIMALSGATPAFSLLALAVAAAFAAPQAHAADAANATVTAGAGNVVTVGNTTTINQGSQNLAIDWTSLSTRANEALIFNQPGASAIALNRITGSSPSELLGSLTANGQVFILNPNGVLFGAGAQVNVGGLVASTLSLSNADFLAGNYKFSGTGSGSVVNQGTLNAGPGGYLALLAPEVRNEGVMTASLGTALLGAGNKVTLNLDNGSLLGYSIDQGAINALAENRQLIQANGGQVLLSAKALDSLTSAAVNNTGVIEAKTLQNKGGRIMLMGDMASGTVNVGGTLDASAPDGGNGGFIETSAAHVNVLAGARVTTLAAPGGTSGTWLIDPNDFIIGAGGNMTGAQVSGALDAGNLIIATAATGTPGGNGDIFVNQSVSWNAPNTLTLVAERDVNINANITRSGFAMGGGLTINAGRSVSAPGTINLGNVGDINVTANQDIYLAQVYASEMALTATTGGLVADAGTDWRANTFDLKAGTSIASNTPGSAVALLNNGSMLNLTAQSGSGNQIFDIYGPVAGLNLQNGGSGNIRVTSNGIIGNANIAGYGDISVTSNGLTNINSLTLNGGAQNLNFAAGSGALSLVTINDATVNLTASGSALTLGDLSVRNATLSASNGLTLGTNIVVGQNLNLSSANGGINQTDGALTIGIGTTATAGNGAINLTRTGNFLSGAVHASNTGANDINLYSGSTRLVLGTINAGGNLIAGSSSGIRLTGGNIRAGGTQTYNNAVTLIANTVLGAGTASGGDINFASTVNGAFQLKTSVAGSTNFSSTVGNTNALASLVVDGTASASNNLITTGAQTYGGTLTSNGATLAAGAGSISLNGLSGSGVTLNTAGTITNTGSTSITGIFALQNGTWSQTSGTPAFSAADFRINGGTFIRAAGGDGQAGTPYQIYDVYGLQGIGSAGMLDKAYLLTANINASATSGWNAGQGFKPIGDISSRFTGSLDGGYHTISGLTVNRSQNYTALVGWNQGTIRNLGLADANIQGGTYTGVLAGLNSGTISNSYASGAVVGGTAVGGLVGYNNGGTISNSYSTASVSGNSGVGGLVGDNLTGQINNSYAAGSVTGISSAGGLVGGAAGSSINSFWNTDTTGQTTSSTGTGIATAQMRQVATFSGAGWNASNVGGDGTTWRIYEGRTGPLLRGFLTASNAASTTVTYNGNTQTEAASGLANVFGVAASGRNAGTYASGYYSNQQGYDLIGTGLTISRANLVLSTSDVIKTYDGTTTAAGAAAAAVAGTAVQAGDSLSGGTFAFTDKNTGSGNKTVAVAGITVNDGNGGNNYNITFVANTTSTINQAALTVTANGVTKTYDGTTTASGTGTVGALAGQAAGESVNASGSQAFLDKNAGSGNKTVRASGVTIQDSNNADVTGNYLITYVDNTSSTIDQAALTVTASGVNRGYDGTTAASGSGTVGALAGATAGEIVGSAGSQAFLDKNFGSNKTVRASGVVIRDSGNADVTGNYAITYVDNTSSSISQAALTVTANGVTKTYDGTTTASGTGTVGALAGQAAGESVNAAGSQAFLDKNYGVGTKTVRASGVTIQDSGGADVSGNYLITYVDNTTSTINQAALTVTANGVTKTYDGTTAASGTGTAGALAGAAAGESLSSAGSQAFLDKSAGSGNKTVRASGVTIQDSTNADVTGNYLITYVDNTSSTINQAALTVTANGVIKTYDGTTTATGTGTVGALAGAAAGETVNAAGSQAFLDKNAGNGNKTVRASGVTIKDATNADVSGNYAITYVDNTSSTINPAALTITANNDSRTAGTAYFGGNGVRIDGLVGGDTSAGVLTGALLYGGSSQGASAAGTYVISASGFAANANYALSYVDGQLVLTQVNTQASALGPNGTALADAYFGALNTKSGTSPSSQGSDAREGMLNAAAAEAEQEKE